VLLFADSISRELCDLLKVVKRRWGSRAAKPRIKQSLERSDSPKAPGILKAPLAPSAGIPAVARFFAVQADKAAERNGCFSVRVHNGYKDEKERYTMRWEKELVVS